MYSSISANVQKKIKKRAIRTITGLGRFYRKADTSGKGVLYRFELEKGLFDYHIDLPPDVSFLMLCCLLRGGQKVLS